MNVGTINVGSTQNLSAELFKTAAGIDFTIVPYRATPEIQVSLLQNNVALLIDSYSAIKGNLADGSSVRWRRRVRHVPKVRPILPPCRRAALRGYDVVSWNALFAPAGTPEAIVTTLNGALRDILADADVKKRLIELGIEAKASTPQEISARLKSDIEKWQTVIEKAGIQKQ